LEALSRGASWVTFFEKNKISLELLKKNISICRANGSTEVKQRDATKIGRNTGQKFDLVFLDPPYGSELGKKALLNVLKEGWLSENAIIVFEYDKKILLKDFTLLDFRKYGKTFVNVFKA
jgi:16S rRNA (guanine966-N2)-methyltransferase